MKKILILGICLILCACGSNSETKTDSQNDQLNQLSSKHVSYSEAKALVEDGAIIIDVRTNSEYSERHIEGAVLLSVDDINQNNIADLVNSKDDVIIVYCASGNRSSRAANTLINLGYTNVYDLGSIDNWEE